MTNYVSSFPLCPTWGQYLDKYLNDGRSELVDKCFVAGTETWE